MELKAILKQEQRLLKHCNHVLCNVRVLYWKNSNEKKVVDLTNEENAELVERIQLRHQIGQLNKQINHFLVERLRAAGCDITPYIKNYWNEIIEGFACTKNRYTNPDSFQRTFLQDKDSPLYRKFPDCLTLSAMKNYITYLKYYLVVLQKYGHKAAIFETIQIFTFDDKMKAYYQEPALPDNWSEVFKQIDFLKKREQLQAEKEK